jgi:hypothetical protein
MEKSSTVQGENHTNPRDAKRLLDDADQAEALYIEGRSNEDVISYWPPLYVLFLMGALFTLRFYRIISELREHTSTNYSVGQEANRQGLEVYSEIDLTYPELHKKTPLLARYGSFLMTVLVFIVGLALLSGQIGDPFPLIPKEVFGVLLLVATPFVYLAIIIEVVLPRSGVRNQCMAESINKHAEKEGFNSVLVLVGDSHVPGIATHLRELGWSVTTQRSTDSTMRFWRKVSSFVSNLIPRD